MNKQTLAKTLNNTLKGDVIMKKAGEEILELLGGNGVDFFQQVFEENLEDRRILINDGIDSGVIEKVVMQIMKYNKEDKGKTDPQTGCRPAGQFQQPCADLYRRFGGQRQQKSQKKGQKKREQIPEEQPSAQKSPRKKTDPANGLMAHGRLLSIFLQCGLLF